MYRNQIIYITIGFKHDIPCRSKALRGHSVTTRQCIRGYAPRALPGSRGSFMPLISQCTVWYAWTLKHYIPPYSTRRDYNVDMITNVKSYFITYRLVNAFYFFTEFVLTKLWRGLQMGINIWMLLLTKEFHFSSSYYRGLNHRAIWFQDGSKLSTKHY